MELWIRSQDKEVLVKVNDIAIEMNMIYGYYDKNTEYELLGSYSSKERALEVLDEIQKLMTPIINYNPVIKKEESWEEEYQRTVLKGYNVKIEQAMTYVYEMPKE